MGSSQRSRKPTKRNKKSKVMKKIHASRKLTNLENESGGEISRSTVINDHSYASVCTELVQENVIEVATPNTLNLKSSHVDIVATEGTALSVDSENSIIETSHQHPVASSSDNNYEDVSNININEAWGTDEEFESIMAHELEIEKVPPTSLDNIISGNRIVNLAYVLQWAMTLQSSHNQICTCGVLYLWKEVMNGLVSSLYFKCTMCNRIIVKTTDMVPTKNKEFPTNVGAVWGTLTSGSTHACLQQVLTSMDIPSLTFRKFSIIEKSLAKSWHDDSVESMLEAGREEHRIAVLKGDIDEEGIAFITVCLDGGWSKRSYGHNYNAASGVAVIIGNATNKVLFLGVRNKFCYVCAKAQNSRITPEQHICFKNWDGSSAAMEADIIMEGFKRSMEMHNLRYKFFIADGDSSTFAKLKTNICYGSIIEKIECKNHAVKNYSKHLIKVRDDKRIKASVRKSLTIKTIKNLAELAKKQISHNSMHGSVDSLKRDLANGPFHIFGQHVNCNAYYCDYNNKNDTGDNKVPQLKTAGLFPRIEGAVEFLIRKSHLLIKNETNNKSEHFMSLLAKYNARKALNLTMRGSFNNRCRVTTLTYNSSGPEWQNRSWKRILKRSPGKFFKRNIINKNRILRYRRIHGHRSRRVLFQEPKNESQVHNQDYGIYALEPELPDEDFQKECERILNNMQVTIEERNQIAKDTIGQFGNVIYEHQRQNRLTSSLFGKIIKRRSWTPCHSDVVSILYSSNFHSDATDYGKINEKVVLDILKTKYGIETEKAGLFIDLEYGFLASSPDGLIDHDGLVEVKCLYSVHKSGRMLEDAAKEGKICLELCNGNLQLKRKDNYYYQVQGQLNICNRDYCYFVVYVDDQQDLFIEKIYRDDAFWKANMLPHLITFFKENVLPEIIQRRVPKKLKCIDSHSICRAIHERQTRK